MYPFKIVITTVKMAKSKLHATLAGKKASVYSGSAGTCHFLFFIFLLSPWEVEGAPDDAHCPSDKVETAIEPA